MTNNINAVGTVVLEPYNAICEEYFQALLESTKNTTEKPFLKKEKKYKLKKGIWQKVNK